MYLWKYWRESRILFAISLLAVLVLAISILREGFGLTNPHPNVAVLSTFWPLFLYLQILPLGFVAWIFGSFGVGRDMGERSGSFVLSRPRSRTWFIWRDWGFGLTQLLIIVTCLNLALWLQMHRVLVAIGDTYHGSIFFQKGTIPLPSFAGITCISAFLLAALVFSLTYFSTILVKNARGVFVSAGILLGYVFLGVVVKHYWPAVELPTLLLREFAAYGNREVYGIADHLGPAMAIRAGVVLLFPLGAQYLLKRIDI